MPVDPVDQPPWHPVFGTWYLSHCHIDSDRRVALIAGRNQAPGFRRVCTQTLTPGRKHYYWPNLSRPSAAIGSSWSPALLRFPRDGITPLNSIQVSVLATSAVINLAASSAAACIAARSPFRMAIFMTSPAASRIWPIAIAWGFAIAIP